MSKSSQVLFGFLCSLSYLPDRVCVKVKASRTPVALAFGSARICISITEMLPGQLFFPGSLAAISVLYLFLLSGVLYQNQLH